MIVVVAFVGVVNVAAVDVEVRVVLDLVFVVVVASEVFAALKTRLLSFE